MGAGQEIDFVAEVTALPTDRGGRYTPFGSNYRLTLDLGIEGMVNDGVFWLRGAESVSPGESATVEVQLLVPSFQTGRLFPGMTFTMLEGGKLTGHGRILEVTNKELKRS